MSVQKVSSFMQTHIVGVSMTTKLGAALKLVERSKVNLLPILHGGRLVGVLTREEIEAAIRKGRDLDSSRVEEIMRGSFNYTQADSDIDDAAKVMVKHRLSRIPVVNNSDDMLCVGVISSTEILKAKKQRS